jgi:glycosyltransferase involved in cell wall biosynthesis
MRVAFFTPTRRECGIADYSRWLVDPLRRLAEVDIVAAEAIASPAAYSEIGGAMNTADVAQIQYEHGFFLHDDAPAENFDAMMRAIRVPRIVTMHCEPLAHPLWNRHLSDPANTFLVHTRQLERRLRGAGAAVVRMMHPAAPRIAGRKSAAEYKSAHRLDGRVVTIFGFTKPHKGYEIALEALRLLPGDITLLIAGGPQDERDRLALAAVQRRADALGLESRLRMTEYVPEEEVGPALVASDIVLAPFTSMTSSGSVATALAWQRPVVASRLEPNVDLQEEFGCLQLFDTGDAADLARQIDRVLNDGTLRQALLEGARRYSEASSFEALAGRMHALYGRAAGQALELQ